MRMPCWFVLAPQLKTMNGSGWWPERAEITQSIFLSINHCSFCYALKISRAMSHVGEVAYRRILWKIKRIFNKNNEPRGWGNSVSLSFLVGRSSHYRDLYKAKKEKKKRSLCLLRSKEEDQRKKTQERYSVLLSFIVGRSSHYRDLYINTDQISHKLKPNLSTT